jgi:choline dehydrogenase-like flavoprotein
LPIVDLRSVPETENISVEVCIVGSGPAGATIARELENSGLRVALVESGGLERQAEADDLNKIESIGWPRVADQWLVRNRMLGGSSNTWTGRCAPFDEIDFETRDWVPHSGWPITRNDLIPFLERSAPHLGLGTGSGFSDRSFWEVAKRRAKTPKFDESLVVPFFWQFAKDSENRFDYMRFRKRLVATRGGRTRIFLNATVTHINVNYAGTAAESIEVSDPNGSSRKISAPCIVLCAGGVENARLLLTSNRVFRNGLGNPNDLVGRYLMDHPRGKLATFSLKTPTSLLNWFGLYNVRSGTGNHLFRHGLRLSPSFQKKHHLLNSAVWLHEVIAPDDPWNALKRILRRKDLTSTDFATVASNPGLLTKGIFSQFVTRTGLPRKINGLELEGIVEQTPDPNSRITLSDHVDRFGIPLSRIDWKIGDLEQRTLATLAKVTAAEFERLGIDVLSLEDWAANDRGFPRGFEDIAHPTGTTRMSETAQSGVVDISSQVHGIDGLFVAGSSVFPTASHVNPTHMIVAIAIRLADKLKQRFATQIPRTLNS